MAAQPAQTIETSEENAEARGIGIAVTLFDRLDEIGRLSDEALIAQTEALADELLGIGETVLESWLASQGREPSDKKVEGFRLLGLHRQGAKGDPSFNACRETCREVVFRTNCARLSRDKKVITRELRLAVMVVRHLLIFVDGKLETAGLGEFCCSSKNIRTQDAVLAASAKD